MLSLLVQVGTGVRVRQHVNPLKKALMVNVCHPPPSFLLLNLLLWRCRPRLLLLSGQTCSKIRHYPSTLTLEAVSTLASAQRYEVGYG